MRPELGTWASTSRPPTRPRAANRVNRTTNSPATSGGENTMAANSCSEDWAQVRGPDVPVDAGPASRRRPLPKALVDGTGTEAGKQPQAPPGNARWTCKYYVDAPGVS